MRLPVLPVLILPLLAACAPTDPAVPTGGPEAWRVLSVGEARPPQGTSPVIRFEPGGRVSGTGACNGFFGPGQITPPVRIGPLGATLMACAPAAMEFDALLHAALGRVDGAAPQPGGQLDLTAAGRPVVRLGPAPAP